MSKKQAIRDMIREYLNIEDTNLNKKEIKVALKDEMMEVYSMKEEPTEHLLKKWMENEMRTELEEKLAKEFNMVELMKKDGVNDYIFKLPKLDKK